MKSPRLWFVVLAMFFTAAVLHVRGDVDRVPPSRPLNELPFTLGTRTATDIPLDQETLDVLGKGDFLNRVYAAPPGTQAARPGDLSPIALFIGYFPTQRTGQSIHSPQNCLPGAGWTFQSSGTTVLTDSTGKTYRVGDYLIVKGSETEEVLYWYQMHGRSIANDYQAKLFTLEDSIRYARTDAALVRITTSVGQGEDRTEARKRVTDFAEQLTPILPAYVPN
jgi:EpsI family protein